ncbi:MAG: Arm DNA-binding domain-containing protein [Pseudomonadota bacterium]|nr:Arm DNA-binding domain-containing protein [Pseudomonadota bacterium]
MRYVKNNLNILSTFNASTHPPLQLRDVSTLSKNFILTDAKIWNTKLETKSIKLSGGGGLYIEVTPSGGKHWRYRFRLQQRMLIRYRSISDIKAAETKCLQVDARLLVKQGINPAQQQKLKP